MPACGFSYGLERVDLARGETDAAVARTHVLVVGVEPEDHVDAVALAAQLRAQSELVVEQDLVSAAGSGAQRCAA